jgi:predicted Zn-dependent protease
MKKLILLFLAATFIGTQSLDNNILIQAMTDELNRSLTSLRIENQDKPYYIAYRVSDLWTADIKAEFGGLVSSTHNHDRNIYVDLRVGSPALDNSNFACQGSGPSAIDADQTSLPLEDDYYALRNSIWLVTDGTYKKALERLSRKKAVIQNRPTKDSLPDLSPAKTCTKVEPEAKLTLDQGRWESELVEISKIFQRYPRIMESSVTMHVAAGNQYFLDSDGNRNRRADRQAYIEVLAKAQSDDGDPLEDFIGYYSLTPEGLPDLNVITQSVTAIAETLSLLTALKKEESYSGPVLFVGQAAAELFFQTLGKGVSDPRTPLYENDMTARDANPDNFGGLTGRMGRRVMPDFLSAYDDPNLAQWGTTALFGRFAVDDQGVAAERADIVKDGKLIGLLMSRAPVKKIAATNGHGRFRSEYVGNRTVGMPAVLVVESREAQSLDELKKKLLATARDYDDKYAIIVTRLTPTRPQSTFEQYMRWFSMPPSGGEKPLLSAPSVAYKVDLETGRAELVRGLDFSSVTERLLRDIGAVSKEENVYNFMYHDRQGNAYPMSVVAPAILIDEMDLVTKETKPTRPPILNHPFFKKR